MSLETESESTDRLTMYHYERPDPPLHCHDSFEQWFEEVLQSDLMLIPNLDVIKTAVQLMCYLLQRMRGKDKEMQSLIMKAALRLLHIYSCQEQVIDCAANFAPEVKRKLHRVTAGLLEFTMKGQEFLYDDKWSDIYRTVGGITFETDEAITSIPHTISRFNFSQSGAQRASSLSGFFTFVFSNLYNETMRKDWSVHSPCFCRTSGAFDSYGFDLRACVALSQTDNEMLRHIVKEQNENPVEATSGQLMAYRMETCPDVHVYLVGHAWSRIPSSQITCVSDAMAFADELCIRISPNYKDNYPSEDSKWEHFEISHTVFEDNEAQIEAQSSPEFKRPKH